MPGGNSAEQKQSFSLAMQSLMGASPPGLQRHQGMTTHASGVTAMGNRPTLGDRLPGYNLYSTFPTGGDPKIQVGGGVGNSPSLSLVPSTTAAAEHPFAKSLAELTFNDSTVKEAENLVLPNLPKVENFRSWKTYVKKLIAYSSRNPKLCMLWLSQIDQAKSYQELEDDGPFPSISAKMAMQLSKKCYGEFGRQITLLEEQLSREAYMLNGRQYFWLVCQRYRVSATAAQKLNRDHLFAVTCRNDNLVQFINDWNEAIMDVTDDIDYGTLT